MDYDKGRFPKSLHVLIYVEGTFDLSTRLFSLYNVEIFLVDPSNLFVHQPAKETVELDCVLVGHEESFLVAIGHTEHERNVTEQDFKLRSPQAVIVFIKNDEIVGSQVEILVVISSRGDPFELR